MTVEKLQANLPLVDKEGRMTPTTKQVMDKLMREVEALQARVTALEP